MPIPRPPRSVSRIRPVRLRPGQPARLAVRLPATTQDTTAAIAAVRQHLIQDLQVPANQIGPVRPTFQGIAPSKLASVVAAAQDRDANYRPPRFDCFYLIPLLGGPPARDLALALNQTQLVQAAWVEPAVTGAADPDVGYQSYWNDSPQGIGRNALAATAALGCDGAGVEIGVLGLGHAADTIAELAAVPITLVAGSVLSAEPADLAHGNATLGILCAPQDGAGMEGAAHGAAAWHYASALRDGGTENAALALLGLVMNLRPGDLIHIELQTAADPDLDPLFYYLPIEVSDAVWQVVRLASAFGIVVVAPAGNGGVDLDAFDPSPWGSGYHALTRTTAAVEDSGAILVGACFATLYMEATGRWIGSGVGSNYGSRVDCFARGQMTYTCWLTVPGDTGFYASDYTSTFGGTSSASAIVSAAAAVALALPRDGGGARLILSALQMRGLLTDGTANTASKTPATDRIGVMPNLADGVSARALELPDLYLRDSAGDDGTPGKVAAPSSPDILLRSAAEGDMSAELSAGGSLAAATSSSAGLAAGSDLHAYVRVQNRGAKDAEDAAVSLLWASLGADGAPSDWKKIGDATVALVPAGGGLACAPAIPWKAADQPASGSCLLLAMVSHPGDPAPGIPDWAAAKDAGASAASLLELVRAFAAASNNVSIWEWKIAARKVAAPTVTVAG